jgi:hypothetical protein
MQRTIRSQTTPGCPPINRTRGLLRRGWATMQLKIFGVGTMVGAAFLITLTSKTWMKPFANKAQAMVR